MILRHAGFVSWVVNLTVLASIFTHSLGSHIPNTAIISYTSTLLQHDIGSYLGLCKRIPLTLGSSSGVRPIV